MASNLDRNSCLYHYTSATGLESILRQRLLRATDTGFLNDVQEIVYTAKPLLQQISELMEEVSRYDAEHDSLQRTRTKTLESSRDAIKRFTHLDDDMQTPHQGQYIDHATYVVCLTEKHDQLSQWRGYGQGGYAIGFRKDGLKDIGGQLRQVLYGDDGVRAVCDEIIEFLRTRPPSGHRALTAILTP